MTPTLDFLIPAHNAEATIAQTLQSLRAQTVSQWRAIVVDDGSTDATAHAVASFCQSFGDSRISLIRQPAAGVAAARNRAFRACSADLVCFLDADDVVAPMFIQTMSAAIGNHDIAACAYRYARPALEPTDWIVRPGPDDHRPDRLAELNPFSVGALVFKPDALRRLIPQPIFGATSHHEDWELLVRLALAGATWAPVVPDPLFTYRLRPTSRTTDLRAMWLDGLDLINRYHPTRSEVAPAQRRWTLRSLARAMSRDDRILSAEVAARLGPLTSADDGTLTGALRWAIRREVTAGSITEPTAEELVTRLNVVVSDFARAKHLAARSIDPSVYWSRIVRVAAARLLPNQHLVLYGLGRNGQEFLARARPVGMSLSFVDDNPPLTVDIHRLTLQDLGPEHIVLVTPDDREQPLRKLAGSRAGAIWLPEQLLMDPIPSAAA